MNTVKPLAALLNSREYLRVMKIASARGLVSREQTKAEYNATLRQVARELYPLKVTD